ncbi:MAG: hypothetical protein ACR2HJ_01780 [Fimbriimonadales bacterium]
MTIQKAKTIVVDAIANRKILEMIYQHSTDDQSVEHTIAPLDIGSTNPDRKKSSAELLFAYSYTHLDKEGRKKPKVCAFKIPNIIELRDTGSTFDPIEIANLNRKATGYDYRDCDFALLPNRDWYS